VPVKKRLPNENPKGPDDSFPPLPGHLVKKATNSVEKFKDVCFGQPPLENGGHEEILPSDSARQRLSNFRMELQNLKL
jgi:hypothetical protein